MDVVSTLLHAKMIFHILIFFILHSTSKHYNALLTIESLLIKISAPDLNVDKKSAFTYTLPILSCITSFVYFNTSELTCIQWRLWDKKFSRAAQ